MSKLVYESVLNEGYMYYDWGLLQPFCNRLVNVLMKKLKFSWKELVHFVRDKS